MIRKYICVIPNGCEWCWEDKECPYGHVKHCWPEGEEPDDIDGEKYNKRCEEEDEQK